MRVHCTQKGTFNLHMQIRISFVSVDVNEHQLWSWDFDQETSEKSAFLHTPENPKVSLNGNDNVS